MSQMIYCGISFYTYKLSLACFEECATPLGDFTLNEEETEAELTSLLVLETVCRLAMSTSCKV